MTVELVAAAEAYRVALLALDAAQAEHRRAADVAYRAKDAEMRADDAFHAAQRALRDAARGKEG